MITGTSRSELNSRPMSLAPTLSLPLFSLPFSAMMPFRAQLLMDTLPVWLAGKAKKRSVAGNAAKGDSMAKIFIGKMQRVY